MKKLVTSIFLLFALQVFAQGEANIWYFGENAGLDFNSGNPSALTNGNINTFEGCSSFSDTSGNLLFYSDGTRVWDKNGNLMPNGTNLKGNPSSTQSAIIVPHPGNSDLFYIFTVGANYRDNNGNVILTEGLHCYTVDMTANSGLGDIVGAPIDLSNGLNSQWTEKVTSVKGADCNTFWVISLVNNTYYAYKIDDIIGLNPNPKISTVDYLSNEPRGYLKVSPDGKKLASATFTQYYYNNVNFLGNGKLHLYNFNDSSGEVSNDGIEIISNVQVDGAPYGVEFSPLSGKLYTSTFDGTNNKLFQYDLNATNIVSTKVLISSQIGYRGALQLAPNGKIYATVPINYNNGTNFLNAINSPEEIGDACNFKLNALNLGTGYAMQGLPPFIASLLLPIDIIDAVTLQNLNKTTVKRCIGDTFELVAQNITGSPVYNWTFNGITESITNSLNLGNLTHSKAGTYFLEVETTDACGFRITYFGEVTLEVYDTPTMNKPTNILQCDTDNDGFLTFDLKNLKDTEVLNGQSNTEFEVFYFTNQTDADANTNAIVNPYTNSAAFSTDTIFARVHNIQNPVCYDTKNFTIQVFELPTPPTSITNLGKCDNSSIGTDTDNLIVFNLQEKEIAILNGQTAIDFTIEYFTDVKYTNKIKNPTTFENSTTIQPIYVKIFNTLNPNCVAFTTFNIEVFTLPTITSPVSLKQCDNDTDGYSAFNLSEVNDKISTNAANETFTFFNSYAGADTNDINELILTPTTYINNTQTADTVWARIENTNGCHRVSEVNLIVSTTGIPATFQKVFYECDDYLDTTNDDRDGVTSFNFSNVTSEIEALFPVGQQLIIKYYRNEADALAEINPISDPSNYRNIGYLNTQIIYIRVDSQLDNDCLGFGAHITLNVEALPIANNVTIDRQCDDDFDGFFSFDISTIESTVLNSQTGMIVSYFNEDGSSLPSPLPNPFSTKSQTITIRVTNPNTSDPDGACFDETTLEFIVDTKPVANTVANLIECDDDYDGFINFDTSKIENSILNGQTGMVVSYVDENGGALPSPLPNPFNSQSQTIYVKVENSLNNTCFDETTFQLIVNPKPQFELNETAIYCLNLQPITVETYNALGNYTYEWVNESNDIISTHFNAIISNAGNYTVIATSQEGCKSFPQTITIEPSIIATITESDITIVDDSENNSITINTTNLGIGDYEFAIKKSDGFSSFYQDEPYFENLIPGIYTIFIRDKNNCGIALIDASIIGFPKFFTPNNDGINDTWTVLGVNEYFYTKSTINIFDRFGKLIAQIDPKYNGWNGIFNGQFLPATDYWFSVELIDKNGITRIKKGHFSLIRR